MRGVSFDRKVLDVMNLFGSVPWQVQQLCLDTGRRVDSLGETGALRAMTSPVSGRKVAVFGMSRRVGKSICLSRRQLC